MEPKRWNEIPWRAVPLDPPTLNEQIESPNPIIRSAEVFRFSLLRLEFWISPTGHIRAWLRLNLFILAVVGIPAVTIAPLIVWLLSEIAAAIALALQIVEGLALIALYSLLLFVGLQVFRSIRKKTSPIRA